MKRIGVVLLVGMLLGGLAVTLRAHPSGSNLMWMMDGNTIVSSRDAQFYPDLPDWTIAGACDLDGNGSADLIWWNPQTGQVIPWLHDANGDLIYPVVVTATLTHDPPGWSLVFCKDINGDGKDDMYWRYVQK